MISVKLHNPLPDRSLSGKDRFEIAFEDGLRPVDVLRREGFLGEDQSAIVVLVNEEQAARDTLLSDGDRLDLMMSMSGG